MTTNPMIPAAAFNDAECVSQSLAGDRDAFARIVAQYQSLICSLAYSATGSLGRSEEVAQETFLVAWLKLPDLREAEKLRPWLCGIARNLIGTALRRQTREPTHRAEPLEEARAIPAPGASPAEAAVTGEEAVILWRSLEQIPEMYREPLILFYRESESTERVAEILELSPDTARQRLSRGRKLLHEDVTAFVEGALRRSAPGLPFTTAVLSALPASAVAPAAGLGASSAKGGGLVKTMFTIGGVSAVLAPLLSVLGSAAGGYFAYRVGLDSMTSKEGRRVLRRFVRLLFGAVAGGILVFVLCTVIWGEVLVANPWSFILLVNVMIAWFGGSSLILLSRAVPLMARAKLADPEGMPVTISLSYRSKATWLGLPLVDLRFKGDLTGKKETARGWIAGSAGVAVGGLFAFGNVAIAPISVGALAIGGVAVGPYAAGLLALGCFAVGLGAAGGIAEGWFAAGGLVVAGKAALGDLAVAREFAMGGTIHALHAGDAAARAFFQHALFFRAARAVRPFVLWAPLIVFIPVLAMMQWIKSKGRKNRSVPEPRA